MVYAYLVGLGHALRVGVAGGAGLEGESCRPSVYINLQGKFSRHLSWIALTRAHMVSAYLVRLRALRSDYAGGAGLEEGSCRSSLYINLPGKFSLHLSWVALTHAHSTCTYLLKLDALCIRGTRGAGLEDVFGVNVMVSYHDATR